MLYVIIIIILIACAAAIIKTIKFKAARAKNYFAGEKGYCIECKNCVYDPTHSTVKGTDYFCRLSKCSVITEKTERDCCERVRITEEILQELFLKFDIQSSDEKRIVREKLEGKPFAWKEVDKVLLEIAEMRLAVNNEST